MNQQQRKYARERITSIFVSKSNSIKEAYTIKGKSISDKERLTLLKSGKVKLRKDCTKITNYTDVADVFDYSEFEYSSYIGDESKYRYEINKLTNEKDKVMDELMLGDAETAIKLIEKFAS